MSNDIAVVILTKPERKKYLDQLLEILGRDIVDVFVYPAAPYMEVVGLEYSKKFDELCDDYKYISFADDDDLVCENYYSMLLKEMTEDVAAVCANQVQFNYRSDIEHMMNNKLGDFSDIFPHLTFHAPSLISTEAFKPYNEEYSTYRLIDQKRLIIKLLQKYNRRTKVCSVVGAFWRMRDKNNEYYE